MNITATSALNTPANLSVFSTVKLLRSSVCDDFEVTDVDVGEHDVLTMRQVAKDGTVHTFVLSRAMVVELMPHMEAWAAGAL